MGNLSIGLKKFLSNKNTVTILGVVLMVIVVYGLYTWRVNTAINPVTVPYAKQSIKPGTQITSDMVGTMEVSSNTVTTNVLYKVSDVIDKYSNADSIIPEGSLFYKRSVVEKEQLPDSIIYEYPSGYVLYYMDVSTETTYGNSIYPGNYIDIYLKAINAIAEGEQVTTTDKIRVGKLIENVKVLAVLDSSGNNVFADLDNKGTPSMLVFAVPSDYFILLKKAGFLRAYDTTLIPVPTNESLKKNPGELTLTSTDIQDFINAVTVWDGSQ